MLRILNKPGQQNHQGLALALAIDLILLHQIICTVKLNKKMISYHLNQ